MENNLFKKIKCNNCKTNGTLQGKSLNYPLMDFLVNIKDLTDFYSDF